MDPTKFQLPGDIQTSADLVRLMSSLTLLVASMECENQVEIGHLIERVKKARNAALEILKE